MHQKHQVPYYHVQDLANESFRLLELKGTSSGCSWHFHPEYQLSFVISGSGQRVVGDSVRPITPGEVTLLGANLPHVWKYDETSTEGQETHSIVIHFDEAFLGTEFFRKPEARDIRLLLARASLGLQAQGVTREIAAERILAIQQSTGFERVLHVLQLLNLLADSRELTQLCSSGFHAFSADLQVERLRRVCDYIQENYQEHIDRDAVAEVAHLTPSAFSRFFKAGTGMTFQEFVAELRIGHACRHLIESDMNVTEIAMSCGFTDVSTFDRSFQRLKSMSPTEYRQQVGILTSAQEPDDQHKNGRAVNGNGLVARPAPSSKVQPV